MDEREAAAKARAKLRAVVVTAVVVEVAVARAVPAMATEPGAVAGLAQAVMGEAPPVEVEELEARLPAPLVGRWEAAARGEVRGAEATAAVERGAEEMAKVKRVVAARGVAARGAAARGVAATLVVERVVMVMAATASTRSQGLPSSGRCRQPRHRPAARCPPPGRPIRARLTCLASQSAPCRTCPTPAHALDLDESTTINSKSARGRTARPLRP